VNSGTKLNITYYLNDLMDEDRQLDAMDYFREASDDSIESAIAELGSDDYTEEELQLMRLKFVSDMGN
jgi:ATP-dependent DNA helicase RecQ